MLGEIFKEQLNKERKERCKEDDNYCKREKFLSRVFGIFSEEIVRIWYQNKESKYTYINTPQDRPTIYTTAKDGKKSHYTLDFVFKEDDANYIVEMKSEIQYQNYKFMVLDSNNEIDYLKHHKNKKAFKLFLDPGNNSIKVRGTKEKLNVSGSILIWGSLAENFSLEEFNRKYETNFHDILSIERMISDLIDWKDEKFKCMVDEYKCWSNDMFDQLVGKPSKNDECKKQTENCQDKIIHLAKHNKKNEKQ